MKLETAILKACQRPAIYPEIEVAVMKTLPKGEPFALAIELARLCVAGRLFYRSPTSMQTEWPAYSAHRFYSKFRCRKRTEARGGDE